MHIIEIIDGIIDLIRDDLKSGAVMTSLGTDYGWADDAPFYLYGSWIEAETQILEKGKSSAYKNTRFPLVFMKLPVTVKKNMNENPNFQNVNNLELYFFIATDQTKNTKWRNENNKQQLIDFVNLFLAKLKRKAENEIEYTETYIPYMEGVKFVFSTPVDAIKLTITDLTITDICLT